MKCIIPLAGPDFLLPNGTIKPLYLIENVPMIVKMLHSRSWYQSGEIGDSDFIFVLRQTEKTEFFQEFLSHTFPGCSSVVLPDLTKGALLTCLAGLSLIKQMDELICVDLVDILYDSDFSPTNLFNETNFIGAIPYFRSSNPKYSYLLMEGDCVKETVEKQVISSHASCGTYFFKNSIFLLNAISSSLASPSKYTFQDSFFLCPSYNPLIEQGGLVFGYETKNVSSFSLLFHRTAGEL